MHYSELISSAAGSFLGFLFAFLLLLVERRFNKRERLKKLYSSSVLMRNEIVLVNNQFLEIENILNNLESSLIKFNKSKIVSEAFISKDNDTEQIKAYYELLVRDLNLIHSNLNRNFFTTIDAVIASGHFFDLDTDIKNDIVKIKNRIVQIENKYRHYISYLINSRKLNKMAILSRMPRNLDIVNKDIKKINILLQNFHTNKKYFSEVEK